MGGPFIFSFFLFFEGGEGRRGEVTGTYLGAEVGDYRIGVANINVGGDLELGAVVEDTTTRVIKLLKRVRDLHLS